MSIRVDTASLIPGAVVVGHRGLGELGGYVRSNTAIGTHGPGFLYGCWDDSSDDTKEFRGYITSTPSSGTFFAHEDGRCSLVGAADGTYTIPYEFYVDGAYQGSSSFDILIGVANASASGGLPSVSLSAITGAAVGAGNGNAVGSLRGVTLLPITALVATPPKPIRKTQYIPTGSVPGDAAGIQRFLQLEFERLNNGLESPFTHDSYEVLHVEPGKKQADRVYLVFADGTDWDPGSGRGFYYYDSGTWTFLG